MPSDDTTAQPEPQAPPEGAQALDVRGLFAELGELVYVNRRQAELIDAQRQRIAELEAAQASPPGE